MLLVVILLFLFTEIPAALIFSVHVGAIALKITIIHDYYSLLNVLLIIRYYLSVNLEKKLKNFYSWSLPPFNQWHIQKGVT